MTKIAIIAGGSGLVGMQLLHQLFQAEAYDYVVSVGRRELGLKHAKLIQVQVDFEQIASVGFEDKIREKDIGGDYHGLIRNRKEGTLEMHAFCSLGTTIKNAGSRKAFIKIDHDYVVNFAKWAHSIGAGKFLYVSAIGADQASAVFYNQVKGSVEEDLKTIPFAYLGIFQPSILLGNRKENRLGEETGKLVMKAVTAIGLFKKYKPIEGSKVARSMLAFALEERGKIVETISSEDMQKF